VVVAGPVLGVLAVVAALLPAIVGSVVRAHGGGRQGNPQLPLTGLSA